MAILVRHEGNETDTVIYLSQRFYELIFRTARHEESGYQVLRQIALLKYKSPKLTLGRDQLETLANELARFECENSDQSQVAEFRAVCVDAIASGQKLWVSGDMYPELHD